MRWDARVPVRFGPASDAGEGDWVLREGLGWGAATHGADCACCAPRSPAALALADLFTLRARGGAEFRAVLVVASGAGEAAVRAALQSDPVASARFRLDARAPQRSSI